MTYAAVRSSTREVRGRRVEGGGPRADVGGWGLDGTRQRTAKGPGAERPAPGPGITSCPSYEVRSSSCLSCSEVELHAELPEARLQHGRWRQPGRRARERCRAERVVVAQDRRRVEQVVKIESDVGPCVTEAEDLREPRVELVDAIAVERTRLHEVHRDAGRAVGRGAAELRDD